MYFKTQEGTKTVTVKTSEKGGIVGLIRHSPEHGQFIYVSLFESKLTHDDMIDIMCEMDFQNKKK